VSSTVALGDPHLDTPAGEHRIDRVVVAVHSDQRLLGHSRHRAAIRIERHSAEWPLLTLLGQSLGRDPADRATRSTVHLLSPPVELVLEVQVVREEPARLEVRAKEPMLTIELPLCLGHHQQQG
jgi:hypothetical protein